MTQNKTVSIAMTTYNGERYLREQLDSIFNQTYKNIEVIVTDDGSKDGTVAILEEYAQKYGLKYYINEKNLGYTKNFEKAASLCTGEYIAFSDQDDIWLPEKIETLVNEIGDFSLIFSDAELIDQNGTSLNDTRISRYYRQIGLKPNPVKDHIGTQGCASLFKKEVLTIALPFTSEFPHDTWVGMVARKMNGITYTDKPLLKYRQHSSNTAGMSKGTGLLAKIAFFKRKFPFIFSIIRSIFRAYGDIKITKILNQRGLKKWKTQK